MSATRRHRILTVDDNPAIHEDFRKIYAVPSVRAGEFDDMESSLFGPAGPIEKAHCFDVDSALQGREGLEKIKAARECGEPFALAFVDVRMPPGWDGIETVEQLWKVDPELQVVICTAYSDYSWDDMRRRLGASDSLVVLKKPFDAVEVLQLSHALTRKWELARQARSKMEELDRLVTERTKDLSIANGRLQTEMAERSKAEEGLRQAQKMEAVGQLAAGVAHDFNNLLTVIQGHTELVIRRGDVTPKSSESLNLVLQAADRAAGLTRQLLLFSRKQVFQPKPIDLNALLERASKLLGRVIGAHTEVRLVCAPGLPPVVADESNLDQVIMNLAVNARDAMPQGGTLVFTTSLEVVGEHSALRNPQARPGTFVCLTVTDTGCGMDAATLDHIFNPFFTTKDVGKGTGLGLSIVYSVIQQHQGWIEVSSQVDHGTTFRAYLPVSAQGVTTPGQTEFVFQSVAGDGGRATILVVEDEPAVRQYACALLASQSFNVLEAGDGVEALRIWSERSGNIELLFTDMVMPNGIGGRALAEKLMADSPGLKVICTSGYSAEALGTSWLESGGIRFLPKPYPPKALLRAVAEHLKMEKPKLGP